MKARQTISSSATFEQGETYFLSAPFIAAKAQHHEESRLIYGPFESTLLDQGFPVENDLDACNPPLYRNTFMSLLTFAMSTATRKSLRHPAISFLGNIFWETFMPLSYNNQDHTFMGDYIIPVPQPANMNFAASMGDAYLAQTFDNALTVATHIPLRHLGC